MLFRSHPYSKEAGNAAETMARQILESRGNAPRLNRNALVFLAADRTRLAELQDATRKYLAEVEGKEIGARRGRTAV